jgi:hypothetical protein
VDVNGDGYADVVIGASSYQNSTGRVYVYLGSASGLPASPSLTLTGPAGASVQEFGSSVSGAGDVNGDGYGDVVVSASSTGVAYLYLGSATGLSGVSPLQVGPGAGRMLTLAAGAGDVNGDGYADIIGSWIAAGGGTGSAYLFAGSAAGVSIAPPTLLRGGSTDTFFGSALAWRQIEPQGWKARASCRSL